MNAKQKNITLFKVGMFAEILLQNLDDLEVNSKVAIDIKNKTSDLIKAIEPMIEEIYKNSVYSKYSIMQEAINKTDTIARKIYSDCIREIENN